MGLNKYIVHSNELIVDALKKIDLNNSGFICVVNEAGQLQGILTDGDIRRELITSGNLNKVLEGFIADSFEYLLEDEDFDAIVKKFNNSKISFLPIVDQNMFLKNVLTKKQFHELLLEGQQLNLNSNFEKFNQQQFYEIFSRPWGFYKTVFLSEFVQQKILHVFPNQQLSLQYHNYREEHWVIVKGTATLTIGESIKELTAGSYIFIPKGCVHRVKNPSESEPLIISEVQLGTYFGEDDIIRIEDNYGRVKH